MIVKALIIAVFAILVVIIGISSTLIYFYSNQLKNKSDFNYWSCKYQLKDLYQRWDIIHNILGTNKIEYFAVGRTLLGAVRHNALIGWDNQIEISILNSDLNKLTSKVFKMGLQQKGIKITKNKNIKWKLDNNYSCFYNFTYKEQDTRINLYVSQVKNQQVKIMRNMMPNKYFSFNTLKPLQKVTFGPSEMYIASKPLQYVNKSFPLWQVEGTLQKDYGQVKTFPLTKYHLNHPNLKYNSGKISTLRLKS